MNFAGKVNKIAKTIVSMVALEGLQPMARKETPSVDWMN